MSKKPKEISLEEMKKLQVEMLAFIDDICKKNDIDYFLIGGSLIGAIRHQGFIPWDDDIDLGLTHENAKKLYDVLKNLDSDKYQLLDNSIQSDYYYPFMKLIDKRTSMVEKDLGEIKDYGVYIDMFTYHNLPDDENERNKHYAKVANQKKKFFYIIFNDPYRTNNPIKRLLKFPIITFYKTIGVKRINNKYQKLLSKYDNTKSDYLMSDWVTYKQSAEIQRRSMVEKTCYHKFENINARIIEDYDAFLTNVFGDYMKLPPKDKQVSHHFFTATWKD